MPWGIAQAGPVPARRRKLLSPKVHPSLTQLAAPSPSQHECRVGATVAIVSPTAAAVGGHSLAVCPLLPPRQENEESFTVAQTYSLARPVWPGSLMDTASDKSSERKNKLLFSHLEGSRHDAAYVDPIPTDYYNWGCSQKPPEDDDSNSYENVLICKPTAPDSGGEESEDYQNSVCIREWRESRRTVGAQVSPSGSPDEEPDYVNGDVAAAEKV
ncbi:linker for activation of T-cells family member 2 isoform X3 [Cricetulus griseus]|uniref:Linker for activation of T-cells family member 2 isoform X3 n=1 Tax=Cricetulus griseus TaxID=10029 RepID=A0A9J7K7Q8_CRIGR|nr:linker for activation of T-cells family member 2 isoform X3 [Cricetulus griseus]